MKIQIVNRIDREFGMVPRSLWTMALPFTAKGLAAYLFCLRDGAMPYVAEIEAATGLGRDARRKAFAALIGAGVIAWDVARDGRGAIVSKTLIVDPSACLAPENQAQGQNHHAPKNPAGGISGDTLTEVRRPDDCGLGDNKEKEKKKERAAHARATASHRSLPDGSGGTPSPIGDGGAPLPAVSALSPLERDQIRRGGTCIIAGRVVSAFSPDMLALQAALRQSERGAFAVNGGVS